MDWTNILGSVASGGVLGLLGNAISFGLNYFKAKQEHQQRMDLLKLEAEVQSAKVAGDIAVAREQGAANAFTASIQAEGAIKGEHRWAITFRAITRPGLTWLGLLASILFGSFACTNDFAQSVDVYTGMMISWWFGQRAIDKSTIVFGNKTANASVQNK